ncbi:MAG TPA: glycosyltransferase family 4 protein [Gemmatimonadales bacterium]|nr:glycosyltransferase family 4 protein [Gemmatimonadales bacterium]
MLVISNAWPPMANGTGYALHALVRDLPDLVALVPTAGTAPAARSARVLRILRRSGRAGGPLKVHSILQHIELLLAPVRWCLGHPRPAVVVCSQPVFGGVAGLLVLKLFGTPYVVLGLGEEFTALQRDRAPFQLRLRLLRAVLRHAAAVVCIAQHTRRLASELYGVPGAKLPVITPSVDPSEFAAVTTDSASAAAIRAELTGGGPLLLSVGRLAETHKGFDRSVEALPAILAGAPDTHLVMAGPGDPAELAALADQLGVRERVHFLGLVPRERLLALYAACDLLLLPGREVRGSAEGFGIVFLEAALAGKPSVAGRVGGAREAVSDGQTGLLVDGDSPAEVAKAVLTLLGDPALRDRLGQAARERALREFDGSRQRAEFAGILDRVAAGRPLG